MLCAKSSAVTVSTYLPGARYDGICSAPVLEAISGVQRRYTGCAPYIRATTVRVVSDALTRIRMDSPRWNNCLSSFTRTKGGLLAITKVLASRYTCPRRSRRTSRRSEEHTSELQSHLNLVCRLLLE